MILLLSCGRLCPIFWSQVLSREWRCSWSSADRRCSNYIWVIDNLIVYEGASYIRDMTVYVIQTLNLLWPSDVIWWHRSRSASAQVMACCLTAPSDYQNQCLLLMSEVLWYSPKNYFTTKNYYISTFTANSVHSAEIGSYLMCFPIISQSQDHFMTLWWAVFIFFTISIITIAFSVYIFDCTNIVIVPVQVREPWMIWGRLNGPKLQCNNYLQSMDLCKLEY